MNEYRDIVPRSSDPAARIESREDAVGRFLLASCALTIVAASLRSTYSPARAMVDADLLGGNATIATLAVLGLLILADLLINGYLPEKFTLRWAAERRMWLYFLTGYFGLMPAFSAAMAGIPALPMGILGVSMFIGGWWLGVRDARAFLRRRQCAI